MKLRIKNNSRGSRGVTVASELVFIDAGTTGEFTGATAAERDTAAEHPDLMVQSEHDGKWVEHFKPDMPDPKQWLAVATDSTGSNMRFIDVTDAEWFIGTALANERPEKSSGFKWDKIGGGREAAAKSAPAKPVVEPVVTPPPADKAFDPEAIIAMNAPDVLKFIETATDEQKELIKIAETDREKPRKGIMDALNDPFGG